MEPMAWINGDITHLAEATISLEDRGYLLGDGVYEVIRVYNGFTFYFQAHLERLHKSAEAIRIVLPFRDEDIKKAAATLLEKSGYKDAYIYIQVTRGSARRDHLFPEETKPLMVIYVRPLDPLLPLDQVKPVSSITLPDQRWLNCHIKTINLLPNLLARQKANESGAVEAILYRQDNTVTEGTRSNVFAVIEGVIRTHPESNLILSGVSRNIVVKIIKDLDMKLDEQSFNRNELKKASEVWITSTSLEVCPVDFLDGSQIEGVHPGPITAALMNEFRNEISRSCGEV